MTTLHFCSSNLSVFAFVLGVMAMGMPTLAQDGLKLADYQRVIIAADALPVTQMAARELSHYAGRVLGRELPVVTLTADASPLPGLSFHVGQAAAVTALKQDLPPWQREEWMIRSVADGMILAGDDAPGKALSSNVAAGSQLAVYTLLDEYLGVRWLWPGEEGEHVPVNPAAVLPRLDRREQPRFIIRNYSVGYSQYHTQAFREDSALWTRRMRLGWVPAAIFGHSWFYAFDLRKPLPENPWYQQHPEWFALVNGQRRGPQVCTSNPEVIQHMVDYVLADTRRAISSISPSDGGGFCECNEQTKSEAHKRASAPSCTALDVPGILSYDGKTPQLSDRIFTYANEIARRVREKDPNKGVGMFAYTFYNKPPVNIKQLEPNLYLSFVFQAQGHVDPLYYQEWLDGIAGWQKIGAKMVVREGWGNHYLLDLPFIHDKEIHNSLSKAADLGFIAAYGEGSKAFATQAPNTWAVVRTLWNPDIDYDAMMDDFYQSAYGPAADAMRAYFDTYSESLHKNWENRIFVTPSRGVGYLNLVNSWHIILPQSTIEAAEAHLLQAEKLAPAGPYAKRVALNRIGQDYTRCMVELLYCYRQLAELGMDMEFFTLAVKETRYDPVLREKLLKRAYELGELREDMLLAHRNVPGPDEGLYAITNDKNMRQWHTNVKRLLQIEKPTRITKELLAAGDKTRAKAVEPTPVKPSTPAAAVTTAAPQPVNATSDHTPPLSRQTPTWASDETTKASDGPAVLIMGENYGEHEVKAIKREIFDVHYTHAKLGGEFTSAKEWSGYRLVIVANVLPRLAEAQEIEAIEKYLREGGRLMLLGTAMRSFESTPAAFQDMIGASGYAFITDGTIGINEQHADLPKENIQALQTAFSPAYAVRQLDADAAALMTANDAPIAYIAQVDKGRVLYIGKELFRVRSQERQQKKQLGGDELRDWLGSLVKQIAQPE